MPNPSPDAIRLQMVMALGQGAGSMLATPEALEHALAAQADLIDRATGDWAASQPAFIHLVRLLGQLAATKAAVDGRPEIEKKHIEEAIPVILNLCPCAPKSPRHK